MGQTGGMNKSPVSPQKIVVGIDGSESAANALQWACALATSSDASVSAVMSWNYPAALLMPVVGTPVLPGDVVAETTRAALAEVVEATPTGDVEVDEWVMMGSPRAVLTEASEDHDLLVLGRTGHSRLAQIFLGSTVSYCVRHAECPVVVVHNSVAPEHQITVAVDGSPSSIAALVWALGLGDEHEVLAVYSHDEWELDHLPLDGSVRADLERKADEMLAQAVQSAVDQTGVDESRLTRQVRQGDPRTTLVDQANPAAMLVLGAQGYSGIARWALGSLADYAVQHAPGTVAIWR